MNKVPTYLKHKPVIVAENYENVDGRMAYKSDAKGLSLGLAQWNDRGKLEISAKIWRYTGEKWSRQSEEMPLHRVLDLTMLICETKKYFQEIAYRYPKLYDEHKSDISNIGLQGDSMRVGVCVDNPMIDTDIELFANTLAQDDELLSERLRRLSALLKEIGY